MSDSASTPATPEPVPTVSEQQSPAPAAATPPPVQPPTGPAAFTFEGKVYQVALRDAAVESAFSRHHADQCFQDLQVFAGTVGPVKLAALEEGWRHDLFSRSFSFGSWLSRRYLFSEPGFQHAAWLLIEKGATEHGGTRISPETIDRISRDPVKGPELALLVGARIDPEVSAPARR